MGTITIWGDTLTRRLGPNRSETIAVFKRVEERVKAIEEWFGVKSDGDEIRAIAGTPGEIRSKQADSVNLNLSRFVRKVAKCSYSGHCFVVMKHFSPLGFIRK